MVYYTGIHHQSQQDNTCHPTTKCLMGQITFSWMPGLQRFSTGTLCCCFDWCYLLHLSVGLILWLNDAHTHRPRVEIRKRETCFFSIYHSTNRWRGPTLHDDQQPNLTCAEDALYVAEKVSKGRTHYSVTVWGVSVFSQQSLLLLLGLLPWKAALPLFKVSTTSHMTSHLLYTIKLFKRKLAGGEC